MHERVDMVEEPAEGMHYASVISHGDKRVKLHSRLSKYVEAPFLERFLDTLRLPTNQNMWDVMYLDNNGEWILETTLNSTLDFVHNWSCQPEISKAICICSTAVWIQCRAIKQQIIVSFAEKSVYASSYRSEILGAIAAQLILRATTRFFSGTVSQGSHIL